MGASTPEFGAKTYDLTSFCRKLHEKCKKLEQASATSPHVPGAIRLPIPLDPSMVTLSYLNPPKINLLHIVCVC